MIDMQQSIESLTNKSASAEVSVVSKENPSISVPREVAAMFIARALEKISSDKETKKPINAKLLEACRDGVVFLNTRINLTEERPDEPRGPEAYLPPSQSLDGSLLDNERLLIPFELACQSKSSKAVITSLDCLQKLIAYGHVPNDALESAGSLRLIERIVRTLCSCFIGVHTDEGVQLQIIKALLTVVISPVVEVHEHDILLIVRTCYDIYMATRNPVNQNTARATLTQMIHAIFQRMEQDSVNDASTCDQMDFTRKASNQLHSKDFKPTKSGRNSVHDNFDSSNSTEIDNKSSHVDEKDSCLTLQGEKHAIIDSKFDLSDDSVESLPLHGNESESENQCEIAKKMRGVTESTSSTSPEPADSTNNVDISEICSAVENEVERKETTSNSDTQINQPNRVESPISVTLINGGNGKNFPADAIENLPSPKYFFQHTSHRDAYLVFRSLCRLAVKPFTGTNPQDPKSHELRSKILSLQLLLTILQQPSQALRSNEVFIAAIKEYLCVAISRTDSSSLPEVFELSLEIFIVLLKYFKQHLKIQIEIFFTDMIFCILESPGASFVAKRITIDGLERICCDQQCIVDAYLNYDCDLERTNIFEKLVIILAKVAQGRHSTDYRVTLAQAQDLRKKGLECLVLILKGMVRWSSDLFNVSNETPSVLGSESSNASTGAANDPDVTNASPVVVYNSIPDDPEAYESRKAQKEVYESGIYQINRGNISKGLAMLQENNLMGTSAKDVAMFLHVESRLCRTSIGNFLGDNEPFALEVMYAYVDCFDFAGSEFVPALRHFLSGFRLPGEAQKIDRLMEKFAARYCTCNPEGTLLASADTAYVLAFSIIMLTTDLHSVKIKQKQRMSKEDYINMNRGINDSQDLPREFLGKIYDEIAQCGIQLRSDHESKPVKVVVNGAASNATNGATVSRREALETASHVQSEFTCATHFEHIRPMFKLVWTPFLAAFSVGLQDCDDPLVALHCLEGIQCAIRIACIFRMELERDAYVQTLARFTLLLSTSQQQGGSADSLTRPNFDPPHLRLTPGDSTSLNRSITEPSSINPIPETMKSKNVDSIRTLISVAYRDGNYLGHSWLHILRCISQLESANVIATTGAPHHTTFTPLKINPTTREAQGGHKRSGFPHVRSAASAVDCHNAIILQEVMGETGLQSVMVAVDKVFSGSVRLDGNAIVDFVKALCQVSLEELALSQPRSFSLQKVVEISYYNIERVRLQWSRIWEHVGQHFITASHSTNEDVALFAVDSLRQLSVKLIEKGELPNFHFQKEFLRPFVRILDIKDDLRPSVQDMVVRCVSQLIQSQWTNIRSGWTNVFLVFFIAASSSEETVNELAFNSCSFVINTVFSTTFETLIDSFSVLIKTLTEFACNPNFPDTSMEAIRLIRVCAIVVSEQLRHITGGESAIQTKSVVTISSTINTKEDDDPLLWKRGWRPIIYELFRIINNCKLDVRTRGLTVFFEIIKLHGSNFHLPWWMEIFQLIFSIFEHGRVPLCNSTPSTSEARPSSHDDRRRLFSGDQLETFAITYRFFSSATDRSEWLTTTCNHTLYSVVDIFSQFFDQIGNHLIEKLYDQLKWCCLQDHEQLARSGTSCLETVILTNGDKFDEEKWTMTVNLIVDLFKTTVPCELLTWRPDPAVDDISTDDEDTKRRQSARTRLFLRLLISCIVQYELIQTVDNVLFFPAHSRQEDAVMFREARNCSAQLNSQLLGGTHEVAGTLSAGVGVSSSPAPVQENRRFLRVDTHEKASHYCSPSLDPSAVATSTEDKEELLINGELPLDKRAMFFHVSYENLFTLIHHLINSHNFAKEFNSNIEQRNILWKAGFKAKAKPNLLKQETQSLATALRILFRISGSEHERRNEAIMLLEKTIREAISYYRSLPVDGHRQAWHSCLLLILTRLVNLPLEEEDFTSLCTRLYHTMCDLVGLANLAPEISALLRVFLLQRITT